jgi:hypothetical protein
MKNTILWEMTPCSLVQILVLKSKPRKYVARRTALCCCLVLVRSSYISAVKMEVLVDLFSEMSVNFYHRNREGNTNRDHRRKDLKSRDFSCRKRYESIVS